MFSTSSSLLFKHNVNNIVKRLKTNGYNKFKFQQFNKRLNNKYFSTSTMKSKRINGKNKLLPVQNNKKKRSVLTGIGLVSATFAANVYSNQVLAAPSSIEDGTIGGKMKLATSPVNSDGVMPFSSTQPKYDQSTFEGRLKSILLKIDPRNVFITDEGLESAQKLLEKYKNNMLKEGEVDDETLWKARETVEAVIHKPTGEKMLVLGRMSAFVLCNRLCV